MTTGGADARVVQSTTRAIAAADERSVVVYIAVGGDDGTLFTADNLAGMDAKQRLGRTWARLEIPPTPGSYDLADPNNAPASFVMEFQALHPTTREMVSVLLDFPAGLPGLAGQVRYSVVDSATISSGFAIDFDGRYVQFADLGSTWLSFEFSDAAVAVLKGGEL